MKKIIVILLGIYSCCLLSSCSCVHGWCAGSPRCWNRYVQYNDCGGGQKNPCDAFCHACTFNEPQCKPCWECMTDNPQHDAG